MVNRVALPIVIIISSMIIAAAILFRVDVKSASIMEAKAGVKSRDYIDLQKDNDFKKTVQYIIEKNCTVDGHVNGDYFYNTKISC